MDIPIAPYSELTEHNGYTTEELNRIFSSEDGVSVYKGGYYYIFYNDSPESLGRIRFTILHELGHIYLNHFTEFDQTALTRNQLTSSEYQVLENEVNCFARNALAPIPVVLNLPEKNSASLIKMFNISSQAARTRLSLLKSDLYNMSNKVLKVMEEWFAPFINEINNMHACMHCGKKQIATNPLCCPICGRYDLVKTINPIGAEEEMIYSVIQTDDQYKPVKCPKCNNEKMPDGNYCNICGTFMFNKCTGLYDGESDQYPAEYKWHDHNGGCGKVYEGDARFCTECGSTTTFFEDGILQSWSAEQEEEARMHAVEVPW